LSRVGVAVRQVVEGRAQVDHIGDVDAIRIRTVMLVLGTCDRFGIDSSHRILFGRSRSRGNRTSGLADEVLRRVRIGRSRGKYLSYCE